MCRADRWMCRSWLHQLTWNLKAPFSDVETFAPKGPRWPKCSAGNTWFREFTYWERSCLPDTDHQTPKASLGHILALTHLLSALATVFTDRKCAHHNWSHGEPNFSMDTSYTKGHVFDFYPTGKHLRKKVRIRKTNSLYNIYFLNLYGSKPRVSQNLQSIYL